MIKLYVCEGCVSCKNAKSWFEAYGIEVQEKKILKISQQELFYLLSMTTLGVDEILKFKGKQNKLNLKNLFSFSDWHLTECVQYLSYHPEFIQSPIIFNQKKYLIGYNSEKIRKFLPKNYRKMKRFE